MPVPSSGYPRTAAVSPRVHVVDQTDSTNALLLRDSADSPDTHPHLSVVLTRNQTNGRGRLDRTWITPPDTAVAVSVLLRVGALEVPWRGWIPLVAGLALTRAVAAQILKHQVTLKWPNDVLVDGRKIAGILTEVSSSDPTVVVVGAGINTTMLPVDLPVPTATSFGALDLKVDEDKLVEDFVAGLRDGIAALAVGGPDAVRDDVVGVCQTIDHVVAVTLPDGGGLDGTATGLDEAGRLIVDTGSGTSIVSAGDVVHVR